ncbi:ARHA protein [Salpingoeca rosetta]|uniref:ARHA protein n=1 Tax=Salpingoeca rosetta (strain ATCC 50818 / BSB-021) TaxID=946362 RepID=F2TW39_SALR5|nr:ARHA protein [Salpingoeca rosetta]EGD72285.1 ARHA protein [Salpingoeca rosetta]|eukprot:XP_004998855.1 ARHA protein [Salpingoeca rosetta]
MANVSKKLVCIGDGSAGKTCLLIVYANNEFPEKYVPTVFENYVATVSRPQATVELALWDTAGQEDYAHIRPLSYDGAHVFLICFAVDNRDSFENIESKWVPEMRSYCPKVPYIIVGCKSDLREDAERKQEMAGRGQTFVEFKEAEDLAERVGAQGYLECSAKTRDGVQDVFNWAADVALTAKTGGGCCTLL